MTNLNKFIEPFGFEPDLSTGPVPCGAYCEECKYHRGNVDRHCCSHEWWEEEYKDGKEVLVSSGAVRRRLV